MDFIITDLKRGISEGHITGNFQDDDKKYKFLRDGAGHVIAVSESLESGGFGILSEDEAKEVICYLHDLQIIVSEECAGSDADKMEAAANIKQFATDIQEARTFMSCICTAPAEKDLSHRFHPDDFETKGFIRCREAGIKILSKIKVEGGDSSNFIPAYLIKGREKASRY